MAPPALPSQVWCTPVSAGFPGRCLAYPTPFTLYAQDPVSCGPVHKDNAWWSDDGYAPTQALQSRKNRT